MNKRLDLACLLRLLALTFALWTSAIGPSGNEVYAQWIPPLPQSVSTRTKPLDTAAGASPAQFRCVTPKALQLIEETTRETRAVLEPLELAKAVAPALSEIFEKSGCFVISSGVVGRIRIKILDVVHQQTRDGGLLNWGVQGKNLGAANSSVVTLHVLVTFEEGRRQVEIRSQGQAEIRQVGLSYSVSAVDKRNFVDVTKGEAYAKPLKIALEDVVNKLIEQRLWLPAPLAENKYVQG